MRGVSLGPILARVEWLASICLPPDEPMLIHWQFRHARCPSCGADLEAHAREMALAEATADRARSDVRACYWIEELPTCPRCGTPLP